MGISKKLRGWVGMGEAVDTIPSILNKCLFVSPDGRTDDGRTPDACIYYKLTCEPTAQVS